MHTNWIDGQWRPAEAGDVFACAIGAESLRWPRSTAADLCAALDVLARAGPDWSARAPAERRAQLEHAARELAREPDPEQRLARALGLAPHEATGLGHALEEPLLAACRGGARSVLGAGFEAGAGAVLVRCDWSELTVGLARTVLSVLADGRPVVLLSDPHAPYVALGVARALAAAELPRGAFALLHEDGEACLQRALEDRRISARVLSGSAARVRAWERWASPRARPERKTSGNGFGAGLEGGGATSTLLRVLRNASRVVGPEDDIEAAARSAASGALSRWPALSGQAPGAVGRVLCHERVLSRFTEALLSFLGPWDDAARPLTLIDPGLAQHGRRAYELGLDEGATPIFTADDTQPTPQARKAAGTVGRLFPVVFTNVEEHMRLAWLSRPAPLLCLLRVESEARAHELAQELGRDPLAEDLSWESAAPGKVLAEEPPDAQDPAPKVR